MPKRAPQSVVIPPENGRLANLTRSVGGGLESLGMVCSVGRTWVLVHLVDDLRFDGFECLRVQDLTSIQRGKEERFAEKMMEMKSATAALEHPSLPLDETPALLKALRAKPLVILECEDEEDFVIGRVLQVDVRSVVIHPIDAAGVWYDQSERIALSEVTRIAFDNHYALRYSEHAPARTKPSAIRNRMST